MNTGYGRMITLSSLVYIISLIVSSSLYIHILTITYRDIDNTVNPEHVSIKTINLYPNRLRMFDWYIIDENNKKEVTK